MKKINKKNIKMMAFDIDGTILPYGQHEFSNEILEMFQKIKDAGYTITIATGREYATIGNIIEQIGCVDYFIGANGAFIFDVKEQKEIYNNFIDINDVKTIYNDLLEISSSLTITDDKNIFASVGIDKNNWFLEKYADIIKSVDFEAINKDKILKITLAHFYEGALVKVQEVLDKHKSPLVITSTWSRGSFVAAEGTDKSHAINTLCKKLGIKMENVMAFGDGSNDTLMIKNAGYGISVRGKSSINKENDDVSKFIIPCPEDLGVLNFLNAHELI